MRKNRMRGGYGVVLKTRAYVYDIKLLFKAFYKYQINFVLIYYKNSYLLILYLIYLILLSVNL